PIELSFRGRKPRKPRLVILLDVSGSMEQYSFFLLRFIYALQQHFAQVDSFLFSTRLMRVTDALKTRHLHETLRSLSNTAEAWASGTRIGECLAEFNMTYAPRVLSRSALVLILSDGLDTGEPERLERELRKLQRRAKKIIWLNPLLGMAGYQPSARGIRAALPLVDLMLPAHNLESLLRLEDYLHHV
ncbi:MAG TPA: VWA domain-containing protein, partial [Rhodothermales bacterium]|nr:VWA domain-containing protein [Rhodothermales bacterium]